MTKEEIEEFKNDGNVKGTVEMSANVITIIQILIDKGLTTEEEFAKLRELNMSTLYDLAINLVNSKLEED